MPLARCIMRCWDGNLTRRYHPGDIDNIAYDHPLAKHFEFVDKPPPEKKADRPTMVDMDPTLISDPTMRRDFAAEQKEMMTEVPKNLSSGARKAMESAEKRKAEKEKMRKEIMKEEEVRREMMKEEGMKEMKEELDPWKKGPDPWQEMRREMKEEEMRKEMKEEKKEE